MNTFQAVLATDEIHTFVLFLYEDIQWGSASTSVGFNPGDGMRGFNLPDASTDTGTLDLEQTSNVAPEYPGLYLFRVDLVVILEPGQGKLNCTVYRA